MQSKLISVIIPVYNAEKTISKCVDSVLCQTYQNFEIILVDDGSYDNSGNVCKEYSRHDIRIRYIRKENGGVSSARNLGIDEAKGEYVTFVDSDDWIEEDSLYNLLLSAIESGADYIIPRSRGVFCKANGDFEKYVYNKDDFDLIVSKDSMGDVFEKLRMSWALYSTCGRLYKKNFLNEFSIYFDEKVKVLEDFCFNIVCLEKAGTVVHISKIVYNYLVLGIENYSSKRKYQDYIVSNIKVYEVMKNFLDGHNLEFAKSQYDFLIGYWIFAIDGVLCSEENFIKKRKILRYILRKVNEFSLYQNCTHGKIDRKYQVLFKANSVFAFFIICWLKKIKYRFVK